jgi:hypothetical protein
MMRSETLDGSYVFMLMSNAALVHDSSYQRRSLRRVAVESREECRGQHAGASRQRREENAGFCTPYTLEE